MDFARVLRRRRMVRLHTGEAVPMEDLERVAHALTRAPSAGWAQGVSGILVTDRDRIAAVAAACGEDEHASRGLGRWLSSAAAHLVICVEPQRYRDRYGEPDKNPSSLDPIPWWWVDGGASLMAVLLAAVDAGISAGFLGGHRAQGARAILEIPDEVDVLGVVTLGPPADDRPSSSLRRERRTDAIRHEHW
jgi:FMN reductase [NAD(P)H]